MDSGRPLLIPLDGLRRCDERIVGGKAARIAELAQAGVRVPRGFCLTTWAYEAFVKDADIIPAIRMELGRKSMDDMRWEEIWDAALRIRAMFLAHPLPGSMRNALAAGLGTLEATRPMAVRSSASGEDSAGSSFAGLHESVIGAQGESAVEHAVRLVWASLWSDAALLYRKELRLDPARSRMAVLVQEVVDSDRSGVGFASDPRDARKQQAIIEAVPGPCSLLVDGLVDPDRWELDRMTRAVISWQAGERGGDDDAPLLEPRDLETILDTLLSTEHLFGWTPDLEWTGRSESFTVLQARPITTAAVNDGDERPWYLTLRPGDARLQALRRRVAEELIPELEAQGQALADEPLDVLDDRQLARAIDQRRQIVAKWKKIYWDEFIPFAHGVRRLATYYNDAVQPEDPYEFVGLLRDQPLLAGQRNQAIGELAQQLASNNATRAAVERLLEKHAGRVRWPAFRAELMHRAEGADDFVANVEDLRDRFLDITYDGARLSDEPEPLLRILLELSTACDDSKRASRAPAHPAATLEARLLEAVGPERHREALEIVETGRVSWKLRDDDNLLVARLQSQLLRALGVASERLRALGRLTGEDNVDDSHAERLMRALRDPLDQPIVIEAGEKPQDPQAQDVTPSETPRQLIGQPASPGVATGAVRCIAGRAGLGEFRRGEVLVCDAIQPTMTHLVPLAGAIVERRGGMLIHGAIIARELGIPCVNGVRQAASLLRDGDLVTVDGSLGIVTVGAADFALELQLENN